MKMETLEKYVNSGNVQNVTGCNRCSCCCFSISVKGELYCDKTLQGLCEREKKEEDYRELYDMVMSYKEKYGTDSTESALMSIADAVESES